MAAVVDDPPRKQGPRAYRALNTLTVGAGQLLWLTEASARRRRNRISKAEGRAGWHRTNETIQIKRGEAFMLESDVPRGQRELVELIKIPQLEE